MKHASAVAVTAATLLGLTGCQQSSARVDHQCKLDNNIAVYTIAVHNHASHNIVSTLTVDNADLSSINVPAGKTVTFTYKIKDGKKHHAVVSVEGEPPATAPYDKTLSPDCKRH